MRHLIYTSRLGLICTQIILKIVANVVGTYYMFNLSPITN